jgi:P27 family predicted phage terminase small subunit
MKYFPRLESIPMPGRKPKPTAIKIAEGNPGKRALNHNEPQPRKVRPKLPAHLSTAARVQWRRVLAVLAPTGVITEAEADLLAVYCESYARYVQAVTELRPLVGENGLRTGGLIVTNDKGNAVRNPLLKIADDAEKTMLRCMAELGMTPSARARLSVGAQVGDALDKFLSE